MSDELSRLARVEIPMSDAARDRVKAAAKAAGYNSHAAWVRSLIAAAVPDLKPEFDELEGWGGNRREKNAR